MQISSSHSNVNNARGEQHRQPITRTPHSRSEVISVWVRVGELCRLAGDECTWKAITEALYSAPVARLEKVWRRIDPDAKAIIDTWGDPSGIATKEPAITPWAGDIQDFILESLSKTRVADSPEDIYATYPLQKIRSVFDGFRTKFSLCPRKFVLNDEDLVDDVRKLFTYWQDVYTNQGNKTDPVQAKFQRIDQFMSLSLAAEPRRKGIFEPYYWTRPPQGSPQSLIPLLFPEPLPTMTLIDRSQILRGRVDSDASDMQYLRVVDGHLRPEARPSFRESIGLTHGGTLIPVHNGDLVVMVSTATGTESAPSSRPSSRVPSRPPSSVVDQQTGNEKSHAVGRTPSIRVKPGSSPNLERKSSVARRNSLPPLSNPRSLVSLSERSSEPPLRVIVQGGTLNCLVDTLVQGLPNVSVSVADDNGEMTLREGMNRELSLDRNEFARVWWTVFRSFVTPLVLFELLMKKYVSAQPTMIGPATSNYVQIAETRIQVLDTLIEWISQGGGAQDILDDTQLRQSVLSFFEKSAIEELIPSDLAASENPIVQQAYKTLESTWQSLKSGFDIHTKRPFSTKSTHFSVNQSNGVRQRKISSREAPSIDNLTAEDLVDNIDEIAAAAFSTVSDEDLFTVSDLLEVQTADRTGWFLPRDSSTSEEIVEIQNIYTFLQYTEPSSLISDLRRDSLIQLLPPSIRNCIRAFNGLRKWLISRLAEPRVGLRVRQMRMELLLQGIEVARLRSGDTPKELATQPCVVRTFVETVLTSAILSPESRAHSRAWQNVAYYRGSSCDSLTSLLAGKNTRPSAPQEALTMDMGWLIERLLDVISTNDLVEAPSQGGSNLVHFDKRRHLYNLISNAPILLASRRQPHQYEINHRAWDRLNAIEREVMPIAFDLRVIKEDAQRENSMASPVKKPLKPFVRIVLLQIEKNRRDKNYRVRMMKEKMQEQVRNEKREDQLARAMLGRYNKKPPTAAQKQHRHKKSMSAFLNFMRPISAAFTSDTPFPPGLKRNAAQLDFHPTTKAIAVVPLMDASVQPFINNERPFLFQLETEDSGRFFLQATSKREMEQWVDAIQTTTKMAAERRLTYISQSPKPELSDHINNNAPSRDPTAVFGVGLETLLQRESALNHPNAGILPDIVETCLNEIEVRGLTEVGIYRIAGAASEINALKDAFNRGEHPINNTTDIYAVCDLVKMWFRQLPDGPLPSSCYHDIITGIKYENLNDRLFAVRTIVQNLPQANFDLLKRVAEHLDKVTDFEENNQMTAEALAIVFSPNLLKAPKNDFAVIMANLGFANKIVKAFVTHFHAIFDESDQDADADVDPEELDSPIIEEENEDELEDNDHLRLSLPETSPLALSFTTEPLTT